MTLGDLPLRLLLVWGLSRFSTNLVVRFGVCAQVSQSVFVPRGVDVPSLDVSQKWEFVPKSVRVGDLVSGGDIIGTVRFL